MHINHLPPELLPWEVGGAPVPGYGFGLGSRVMMDVGRAQIPGSPGEYGWDCAAKTYYIIRSFRENSTAQNMAT